MLRDCQCRSRLSQRRDFITRGPPPGAMTAARRQPRRCNTASAFEVEVAQWMQTTASAQSLMPFVTPAFFPSQSTLGSACRSLWPSSGLSSPGHSRSSPGVVGSGEVSPLSYRNKPVTSDLFSVEKKHAPRSSSDSSRRVSPERALPSSQLSSPAALGTQERQSSTLRLGCCSRARVDHSRALLTNSDC